MTTSTTWKKGDVPNPTGRPKGTGKPISRLRKLVRKLQDMEEKALENIDNAINGIKVDKDALDTSKWAVTTIVSVNRAATQEEQLRHEIQQYNDTPKETKPETQEVTGNVIRPSRFANHVHMNSEYDGSTTGE